MKTEDVRLRDPFIFAENDKYYMYGTEVEQNDKCCFKVYESVDLENWSEGKIIFQESDEFWAKEKYWAPELHKYNGKYYLFASFCGHCTQILESDLPNSEFIPIADAPTEYGWQCIDGTLYVDKKGRPYIAVSHNEDVYKERGWHIRESDIEALELSRDLKNPVGKPFSLFHGCDFEKSKSRRGNRQIWHVTEGPFFFRSEENLYILWSGFKGEIDGVHIYFQAVAKSDNGEIDGNWIFQNELLYEDDGGHGMVFKDFDGKLKLVIHRPNSGRGCEHPLILDVEERDGKLLTKFPENRE